MYDVCVYVPVRKCIIICMCERMYYVCVKKFMLNIRVDQFHVGGGST